MGLRSRVHERLLDRARGLRFRHSKSGLFVGLRPAAPAEYDKTRAWAFELDDEGLCASRTRLARRIPRCVWQLLKEHFARYDVEPRSCNITGTPTSTSSCRVCDHLHVDLRARNAIGDLGSTRWGPPSIPTAPRTSAVVRDPAADPGQYRHRGRRHQRHARRGERPGLDRSWRLLFHNLPGYLHMPRERDRRGASSSFLERDHTAGSSTGTPSTGGSNKPKYIVSLLKAWWGEHATAETPIRLRLPAEGRCRPRRARVIPTFRSSRRCTTERSRARSASVRIAAVGGPNATLIAGCRSTSSTWLVVVGSLRATRRSESLEAAGRRPRDRSTPRSSCCPQSASIEKEGSVVNSGRWMQWRYEAMKFPR